VEKWTEIIQAGSGKKPSFGELWRKKDLILLFVRRDFVKEFKQTILGPLWFVIQPIFQTIVLLFVFGNLGGMGPTGIPQVSFYLGGTLMWNLFAENLLKSSETFRANQHIFGKVYFPRMVIPISLLLTNFLKLGVQLLIFFAVYFFEVSQSNLIEPNWTIALVPLYFIVVAISGMGVGLIISSMTTKYWDLRFLVQFGIQLLMFLSTVITPFYVLKDRPEWMQTAIMSNPVSSMIEAFRNAFLGPLGGEIHVQGMIYSVSFSLLTLVIGVFIFNKVEKNFMDTV
jgi:homopolymeric O-antigen transport system permease protein